MILNPAETEALVRAIDGLENYTGISLSRRDSLDNEHADGFLVVRVNWNDGDSSADVISSECRQAFRARPDHVCGSR